MTIECPECGHEWDPVQKNGGIPDMVTTSFVAQKFGVKPRTVRRWIESGRLPVVKIKVKTRTRYYVRIDDVLSLMSQATEADGATDEAEFIDV